MSTDIGITRAANINVGVVVSTVKFFTGHELCFVATVWANHVTSATTAFKAALQIDNEALFSYP